MISWKAMIQWLAFRERAHISSATFGMQNIAHNDEAVKFYIGLATLY